VKGKQTAVDRSHEGKPRNHLFGAAICPEHKPTVLAEVFVVPIVECNGHLAVVAKHDACNPCSGGCIVFGNRTHDCRARWQSGDACQLSDKLLEYRAVDEVGREA